MQNIFAPPCPESKVASGTAVVQGDSPYQAPSQEAVSCRVEEDDSTVISCSASFNTLNLILRDSCLMKFVKFVSHAAPSSRYDLAAAVSYTHLTLPTKA